MDSSLANARFELLSRDYKAETSNLEKTQRPARKGINRAQRARVDLDCKTYALAPGMHSFLGPLFHPAKFNALQ